MLSYQHIYHAGNFADVQKHALLVALLNSLAQDTAPPLHMIDTHAGRGIYSLAAAEAQKTKEHLSGITPLLSAKPSTLPPVIRDYLSAIGKVVGKGRKTHYPGSAALLRVLSRANDRLIAAERHPGEYRALEKAFEKITPAEASSATELYQDDGFEGLSALPPPRGTRGLAVIDPSYEIKSEYASTARAVVEALTHGWTDASFFIWYPILAIPRHEALLDGLCPLSADASVLCHEIRTQQAARANIRLAGSGIVLINPPWPQETLSLIGQDIARTLSQHVLAQPVESRVMQLKP